MLHEIVEAGVGSPLQQRQKMSGDLGIDLRVKRDDLLPLFGGGNKARKIVRIAEQADANGCDSLVTCGGVQSNHARATALAAASRGWRCSLVLHGSPNRAESRGNLMLARLAGAEITIVRPQEIGVALDCAMERLRSEGYRPMEIPGGGHCTEGAAAYADAVDELHGQCRADVWTPDVIVLASGTGTTQAGIAAGVERVQWPTRVIGISVAREKLRGTEIVASSYAELRERLGLRGPALDIDFRDDWTCGGYEAYDKRVLAAIHCAATNEGLLLDPTYTGKAFAALLDMVKTQEIARGSSVLFWHTGGLFNLLASAIPAGTAVMESAQRRKDLHPTLCEVQK